MPPEPFAGLALITQSRYLAYAQPWNFYDVSMSRSTFRV